MRNSYGLSDRFSAAGGGLAGGGVDLDAAGFPTGKYFRILSRRFAPRPRIASKSSTLLKGPYVLRICKILPAVAGPIPGTCCSCSEFAVLRLTGRSGGFFFAKQGKAATQSAHMTRRKSRVFSGLAAISGAS